MITGTCANVAPGTDASKPAHRRACLIVILHPGSSEIRLLSAQESNARIGFWKAKHQPRRGSVRPWGPGLQDLPEVKVAGRQGFAGMLCRPFSEFCWHSSMLSDSAT